VSGFARGIREETSNDLSVTITDPTGPITDLSINPSGLYIPVAQKGAASGVAALDANSNVVYPIQDKGGQVFNVKAYGARGDGTTDDTTALLATIAAALPTAGAVCLPPGNYITSSTLAITPTNTGSSNLPQAVPSLVAFGGAGKIGDEADTSAVTITASATFPIGKFMVDYQQVGTPYGVSGAVVHGITLDNSARGAGFRAQGAREFHVSDVTIVHFVAPVTPGDSANGAFNMTVVAGGMSGPAYNLIEHVTAFSVGGADCFWDDSNAENTYIACRALAGSGASYHVVNSTLGTIANPTYIDCHYAGGVYGVIVDVGTAPTFTNLSLFNNSPWPSKNALKLTNGWQYNEAWQYPPTFTACRFINGPATGVSEVNGAIVNFVAGGAYNIDAVFTACMFGTGTAFMSDFVYVATGITVGGVVTFRDCIFLGTPTVQKVKDLSNLTRYYNCKGINPVGSSVPGTAFALAASGVAWTNLTGVDGTLYTTGAGTVTAVSVNGVALSGTLAIGDAYRVVAGGTFTLTYTVAPTLVFVGD